MECWGKKGFLNHAFLKIWDCHREKKQPSELMVSFSRCSIVKLNHWRFKVEFYMVNIQKYYFTGPYFIKDGGSAYPLLYHHLAVHDPFNLIFFN